MDPSGQYSQGLLRTVPVKGLYLPDAIASNSANGRSDDESVEPEAVTIVSAAGRTIAAIGLERTSAGVIAMYEVTDPAQVSFLRLIRSGTTSAYRVEVITVSEADGKT